MNEEQKRKELIRKIMQVVKTMSAHERSMVYAYVSAFVGTKEGK